MDCGSDVMPQEREPNCVSSAEYEYEQRWISSETAPEWRWRWTTCGLPRQLIRKTICKEASQEGSTLGL